MEVTITSAQALMDEARKAIDAIRPDWWVITEKEVVTDIKKSRILMLAVHYEGGKFMSPWAIEAIHNALKEIEENYCNAVWSEVTVEKLEGILKAAYVINVSEKLFDQNYGPNKKSIQEIGEKLELKKEKNDGNN